MFEGKGTGIDWSNWTEGVSVDDDFCLIIVMIFLFAQNFIHLTLMYYFENIMPGNYGIAKPWYFPISFIVDRFKKKKPRLMHNSSRVQDENGGIQESSFSSLPVHIEEETIYSNRNVGVRINGITKYFKQLGMTKKAVNNLSLNIYDGQITVLLGHNGAGKRY
jgi:ATP-binding cassette subfamily A (ABC1) protein 3